MKRINWNKFNNLYFDSYKHEYIINGQKYISVTQLLNKFKTNIFTEKFIEDYANRKSFTIDYVKSLWNLQKEIGALRGTEIHFYIESFLKYEIKNKTSPLIQNEVKYFHNFYNEYLKDNILEFKTEYRLYDEDLKIAGTLDLIVRTKDDKIIIYDWKSNESLFNDFKQPNFLFPLDNLEQTNINIYTLQLSLYQMILEHNLNIEVSELNIVHLNSTNDNYKIIPINYDSQSISSILSSL